jgi:hypothetical protein
MFVDRRTSEILAMDARPLILSKGNGKNGVLISIK